MQKPIAQGNAKEADHVRKTIILIQRAMGAA